jgi:hypothetical protein
MDLAHEVSRLQGALKAAEWEAADARRHGANIQAWGDSLQAELDRVKGSRRYRAVAILGTSVEALRRIRRRGR